MTAPAPDFDAAREAPHKAVAFERGTSGEQGQHKGYAARCETCEAVTFGGFRTKTEAKAALEHDAMLAEFEKQRKYAALDSISELGSP